MIPIKKTLAFWLLLVLFACSVRAQTVLEARTNYDDGHKLEEKLYPNFTEEVFTKTVALYEKAGNQYYSLLLAGDENRVSMSFHTLQAWLAAGELLEAMNRYRAVCDLYVNTFDNLLAPTRLNEEKDMGGIKRKLYDSLWLKTLWMLYFNTVQAHKDIYVLKYGNLLKAYLPPDDAGLQSLLVQLVQSSLNLSLAAESFAALEEICLRRNLKWTDEQKNTVKQSAESLRSLPDFEWTPQQRDLMERCVKAW